MANPANILVDQHGAPLRHAPQARYDVTDQRNAAGGRKRRQWSVERGEEEDVLLPRHRLGTANLTRDGLRNIPQARGLAKTLRTNVVGSYGKLRFAASAPWYDAAQRYFNSVFARSADFVDGTTWRECLQLVVYAIAHEGDFVAVHDDGILSGDRRGTGKFAFFESDQICDMAKADFQPFAARGYSQAAGVIRDRRGRQVGVVVTRERGLAEVPRERCWVLIRDPDAPAEEVPWIHCRRKFRLRQARGVGDAVTALQSQLDAHEILGYELQTAKAASARYATVYEGQPSGQGLPGGFDGLATGSEAETAQAGTEEAEAQAEALERYTGGNVDYLTQGDKVEFDPPMRPNPQLAPFLDYVTDLGGAAHGVAHAYARGRADSSYTAFRGDMVMTWMTFADFQQFLEDGFSDWAAVRVLRRAVRLGELAAGPEGWEALVAWQYPTMPAVDEDREQSAVAKKLKNGLALFRAQIGPHWREHFEQLAEEVALARTLGLPLSILETAAGAPASKTAETQDGNAA